MGTEEIKGKTTNWKTHAEFSYINISGIVATHNLLGKFNIKKENKKNRYFLKSNIQYGENYNDINKVYEKTINKWLLNCRYERIFVERLFGFLSINYIDNEFSGYDYNILIGPGCGYDIVKIKKHNLKGFLSTIYIYDRFTELEDNKKFDSYGSRKITIDYIWNITEDFILKKNIDYSHSFENSKKYFINSEIALELKMNTFIFLGLSYNIAYKNNTPKDIKNSEKTFLTSIIIDL
jgi:putative salt-induced outer membrane protein